MKTWMFLFIIATSLLLVLLIFSAASSYNYSSDGDLRGTQIKFIENKSDISSEGIINISKAVDDAYNDFESGYNYNLSDLNNMSI